MSSAKKSGDPRLRLVPSVDELLRTESAVKLRSDLGIKRVTALARLVTGELRASVKSTDLESETPTAESLLEMASGRLREFATLESRNGIRNVINATGVILHTNLGRAPLSKAAQLAVSEEASRYCTLEYDNATGLRGKRGARVEALLRDLTGAEDALVVNNCAAAALLILGVIAGDGETDRNRGIQGVVAYPS